MAEFEEFRAALVGREEIHESFVVTLRQAEQPQQASIVSAAHAQSAPHELPDVVTRDVAFEEERVNVLPERISSADDGLIEFVGHLAPALLAGTQDRLG